MTVNKKRRLEYQQKAANVAVDLTKQFITLAFAGIAFVVGLAIEKPGFISEGRFWSIVSFFGCSIALGIVFIMRHIAQLGEECKCDVYHIGLRLLSVLQIVTVCTGAILLVMSLNACTFKKSNIDTYKASNSKSKVTKTEPANPIDIHVKKQ